MKLTSLITRTATIALAAAALAAPTASARPADLPPAAAKANAAEQHKQARRSTNTIGWPTRPAQGEQANPRPDSSLQAPSLQAPADRGSAWTTILLGAASLLALAAIAGITRHKRRDGRARITA